MSVTRRWAFRSISINMCINPNNLSFWVDFFHTRYRTNSLWVVSTKNDRIESFFQSFFGLLLKFQSRLKNIGSILWLDELFWWVLSLILTTLWTSWSESKGLFMEVVAVLASNFDLLVDYVTSTEHFLKPCLSEDPGWCVFYTIFTLTPSKWVT